MNKKIERVLSELEKRALYEQENYHKVSHDERMLAITKDTGIFYNILLKAQNPKRILEVGTSTGYSTLWFAEAIRHDSKIITIEQNPKKIKIATRNFKRAGVQKKIEIRKGAAEGVLKQMLEIFMKSRSKKHFDFIFLDADKESYSLYFDIGLKMLKKDGIIAADNIIYPKRFNKHIKKYLEHVNEYKDVQTVVVPIGNGQQVSIKT